MATCTECMTSMPMVRETLNTLRGRTAQAQGTIGTLLAGMMSA